MSNHNKPDYHKEWRAVISKPTTHDGRWGWKIEYRETWTERDVSGNGRHGHADSGWRRFEQGSPKDKAPETVGMRESKVAAESAAKECKDWYEKQDQHEDLPEKIEVSI